MKKYIVTEEQMRMQQPTMTRTEIIELAKQASGTAYTNRHYDGTAMAFGPDALERFANLVAAKEREICHQTGANSIRFIDTYNGACDDCIEAIRSRT